MKYLFFGRHCITTLLLFLLIGASATAQKSNPAYRIFNEKSRSISYKKFIKGLAKADVILFGEYHNNPICHWLQLEVAQNLYSMRPLILGAEMFETDNQRYLDQYLQGKIDAKGLDSLARLWNNFSTDYKPLVDFAFANGLSFIATNIPRRYASMVYRGGFESLDTLTKDEYTFIAPLPIKYDPELPGYKNMVEMMGGHGGENLPKAQAIKDATMAYNIAKNFREGSIFLHLNGAYHSDDFEGIYWYLKELNPDLKIVTITSVSQENLAKLDAANAGKANYTLCIPANMTPTY